jgi:hypothetical protein
LRPKAKTASPFGRLTVGDERAGLGLSFVVVLVAQIHTIIVVFNLVIIRSKKKFAKRLPCCLLIAALKVLQPPLLCQPPKVHLELSHANHPLKVIGREPVKPAPLTYSISQHFGFHGKDATVTTKQGHDDDFAEANSFRFKFTVALTAERANGLVATIERLKRCLKGSGNAIKAVVAFAVALTIVLVTVATIVSVNVRAQQNANCLHVGFACNPTALVTSQRHERLFSRTPT